MTEIELCTHLQGRNTVADGTSVIRPAQDNQLWNADVEIYPDAGNVTTAISDGGYG